MALQISERALAIKPSATLTVAARALALKAAGKDIVSLAAGEPDFDTPEHIKAAAVRALAEGFTKYTAVEGTPSLKRAVVEKLWRENGLEYAADQVLVSCGCKHSFYNLVMALLNPGDEAMIPAPYWTSYPDMVALTGAVPVAIDTGIDDHFKMTPAKLAGAITPRTRLLVLNSPSNPTGEYYSRAELVGLAEVLLPHPQVLIASDDMYEHILWHARALREHPERLSRALRPHDHIERRLQGLRHDRLADRLRDRAETPHPGHGHPPIPEHLEPDLDRPGRGRGGAHRGPVPGP